MKCGMKNAECGMECTMRNAQCVMRNAQCTMAKVGRLALAMGVALLVSVATSVAEDAPKALTPAEKRARDEAIRARLREMENEVGNLMNPSRKNNRVEGIELMRNIASDKDFPFGTRVNYVKRMLKDGADGKNTVLWTNSIPFAQAFLATEPNVTDKVREEVLGLIFNAHRKAGMEEARAEAREIMGNPLCDNGTKADAARYIARRALAEGGQEAAFTAIAKYSADNPLPCARAKSWILDECYDYEGADRVLHRLYTPSP